MDYFDIIQSVAKRQIKGKVFKPNKHKSNEMPGLTNAVCPAKKKSIKKSPEKIVTDVIVDYLLNAGYLVVKINSSNLFSSESGMPLRSYIIRNTGASSGFADLLAMKNEKVLLIEVKSEKGKLSESQERFRDLCTQHKIRYIVAKSIKDIEMFVEFN